MALWQPPDLVLVGCVKTKRRVRSAAKDLYTSPLWRYRRAYAEHQGVPWYILSALHGLLDPDRRIDAYELALTDLRAKARRAWSDRVLADVKRRVPSMRDKRIEIHAGATYIDHGLEEGLRDAGAEVHRPLAGIAGIARQQAWYRERLDVNGRADQPHSPARSHAGRIAKLIADHFYGDGLDLASRGMAPSQPWLDMPEVEIVHRLRAAGAESSTGTIRRSQIALAAPSPLGVPTAPRVFFSRSLPRWTGRGTLPNSGTPGDASTKTTRRALIHSMSPGLRSTSFAGC